MLATESIKRHSSDESKMPTVFWIDRAELWSCRIGYNMTPNGRQRAQQYIKEPHSKIGQTKAEAFAIKLQEEWEQIKSDWAQIKESRILIAPELDWSKPVWPYTKYLNDLAEKKAQKLQTDISTGTKAIESTQTNLLTKIVQDNPTLVRRLIDPAGRIRQAANMTIEAAVNKWLESKKSQIGLVSGHGINDNSYNNYKTAVELSIAPLDKAQSIDSLNRIALEGLVNHWLKLPISSLTGNPISERTAVGYCKIFKSFLNWLSDQEQIDWQMPKGCEKLFKFRGFNKSKVHDYATALPKIKRLLANASDRTRLYMLLAMNLGATQVDVADAKQMELIEKDGQTYLWRQRSKTSNQNGYEVLHWLFPETAALLKQHMASTDPIINPDNLLLLNEAGGPLLVAQADKAKTDNVGNAFKRLRSKLEKADKKEGKTEKFGFSFKQFRKVGATAIKRLNGADTSRMYLGQVIGGVLQLYAQDDFAPVTQALRQWYAELQSAQIFPAQEESKAA